MRFVSVSKRNKAIVEARVNINIFRRVIPGREPMRANPESDELFWIPDQPALRAVRKDG